MPKKTHLSLQQDIDSLITLAQAIIAADALPKYKRKLLDTCLWKASEVAGKYTVPYWSEGVFDLVQKHGSLTPIRNQRPAIIQHEHVNTRQSLIDLIMRDPTSVERVFREQVFACLVTNDEHDRLSNKLLGFDRYRAAGIRVWDVQNQRWTTEI